jgi:murein L,D-transpeptidase YafK
VRHVVSLAIAFVVFACTDARSAAPLHVTRVHIVKKSHRLELISSTNEGERVVKWYRVAIGPGGDGPKTREGDKITPTGHYVLSAARPSAKFRTFIAVSYPNDVDRKRFASLQASGAIPKDATIGGDIGIHGVGNATLAPFHKLADWTRGCVAVDNEEIDEIATLVPGGTPIDIED